MGNCCSTAKSQAQVTTEGPTKTKKRRGTVSEEDDEDEETQNGQKSDENVPDDSNTDEISQNELDTKSPIQNFELSPSAKENVYVGWRNAINSGNNSLVEVLLEDYPNLDLLEYFFENSNRALHLAVSKDNKQLALFLLSSGAQVNATNDDGDTPLHCAVKVEDIKLVTLLLKYRADPSVRNKKGETVLDIARQMNLAEIAELYELNVTSSSTVEDKSKLHDLHDDIIDQMEDDFDTNARREDDEDEYHGDVGYEVPDENPEPKLTTDNANVLRQISRNDPFRAKKINTTRCKKSITKSQR